MSVVMAVWSFFRVMMRMIHWERLTGLGCGLPVVEEVESSLQDAAACVELRGGVRGETVLNTARG